MPALGVWQNIWYDFIWVNIGFNSTIITAGNKYVRYKISFLHIMEVNEEANSEDKVVINFTKKILKALQI